MEDSSRDHIHSPAGEPWQSQRFSRADTSNLNAIENKVMLALVRSPHDRRTTPIRMAYERLRYFFPPYESMACSQLRAPWSPSILFSGKCVRRGFAYDRLSVSLHEVMDARFDPPSPCAQWGALGLSLTREDKHVGPTQCGKRNNRS